MKCRFALEENRFDHKTVFLKPGMKTDFEGPGARRSQAIARVRNDGGQLIIGAHRGEVLVNEKALTGEQKLADMDRIGLRHESQQVTWVYQADPRAAKAARLADEQSTGISTETPSSGAYQKWLRVDERSVLVKGLFGSKTLSWDEFDEVQFVRTQQGGLVFLVMDEMKGKVGKDAFEQSFLKGVYTVYFMAAKKGSTMAMKARLMKVAGRNCAAIAHAMDHYAPLDVVKLPSDY